MRNKVSQQSIEAIRRKDVYLARAILTDALRDNPGDDDSELTELSKEFERAISVLFLPHDSDLPLKDDLEWDRSYLNVLRAELGENFSRERFEHAIKVGKSFIAVNKTARPTTKRQNASEPKPQRPKASGRQEARNDKPADSGGSIDVVNLLLLPLALLAGAGLLALLIIRGCTRD